MRCVTYAGETVITTDDVAEALVELTAAVAAASASDAVTIPIVDEETHYIGQAQLVIGIGNDVLSSPTSWDGDEPDFSSAASTLRQHLHYPQPSGPIQAMEGVEESPGYSWDPDLDGFSQN